MVTNTGMNTQYWVDKNRRRQYFCIIFENTMFSKYETGKKKTFY